MVRLAPNGTVPMIRLHGRSLDIMVAGTSASKPARRINERGRNWERQIEKAASATMRPSL
jgi:hypothetical protein